MAHCSAFRSRGVGGFGGVRAVVVLASLLAGGGCSIRDSDATSAAGRPNGHATAEPETASRGRSAAGRLTIDGSSTVYPITQAVAEEFGKEHPKIVVTIGISGTGGGFKRFAVDDLDVCDASRTIEEAEIAKCKEHNVQYVELKIGIDGISVVVNAKNTWCHVLTVDQLRRLWNKDSRIRKWSELDPNFPDREIVLYGPDTDSGTFDYFTEVICGKKGNSRSGSDYTPSSDDNVLIQGVKGDEGALGYFGYAYYALNKDSVRAVRIAAGGGKDGIAPSHETILSGAYKPLSRPLFLYVNKKVLSRPEAVAFLTFYLDRAPALVKEVHYVPLSADGYAESRKRLADALKGS